MPLWLRRLLASVFATLALAQLAFLLVASGALHAAVTWANPNDPTRQLERSLVHALRNERADVVIVGHSQFVDAVQRSCRLKGRLVPVTVDGPRWRDYELVATQLAKLNPSLFFFQARPHLWTNIYITAQQWSLQRTELLPRTLRLGSIRLLYLWDVRALISALEEMARGPRPSSPSSAGLASFVGALFEGAQNKAHLSRIVGFLKPTSSALFVLDPDEIPDDALPETRQQILDTFMADPSSSKVQLITSERFSDAFGCDREALRAVAAAMHRTEPLSGAEPAAEEE